MQARFLLGPAGSGKTFRCLAEIRAALCKSPDGPPLILLAPKQATFQLERQLLGWGERPREPLAKAGDDSPHRLFGYTRLRILSFERLAQFVLDATGGAQPELLSEEGRVMVLRALVVQRQGELKTFRASARLTGFAQQLSLLLREFQRHQLSPARIAELATQADAPPKLRNKLHDLALLLRAYGDWLNAHRLQDANHLLDVATAALRHPPSALRISALWLDGFAEMTPQELDLLAALLPLCEQATLAFCLAGEPEPGTSWLSGWSVVAETFRRCRARLAGIEGCEIAVERIPRHPGQSRFTTNEELQKLEANWSKPARLSLAPGFSPVTDASKDTVAVSTVLVSREAAEAAGNRAGALHTGLKPGANENSIRCIVCAEAEAEAVFAARQIRRFICGGGRYRECAVILRQLESHHAALARVFRRYGIPAFMDHREPVAHHPLAELTRFAFRTVTFGWRLDDWFGALKTGLVPAGDDEIDALENAAVARGWQGAVWHAPLPAEAGAVFERLRQRLVPPFAQLAAALRANPFGDNATPTGRQVATAIREFWRELRVEETLARWSDAARHLTPDTPHAAPHSTVFDQMHDWLENLERAFPAEPLPLRDWLPILEAGLASLTVGVIPPALDQVLVGAIDRSRNPDLKLALVLGLNEGVFPAPPAPGALLTDADRTSLERHGVYLGPTTYQRLGHERYLGYIACTRASERLVLTCAARNADGQPLNPSPFFEHVKQLAGVAEEQFNGADDWTEAEHVCELAAPVLRAQAAVEDNPALVQLGELPAIAPLVEKWRQLEAAAPVRTLASPVVEKLFGRELATSVSALEDFAACPFKFFAARGLRLEERRQFAFDDRDKGSFQHELLREFHRRIQATGRMWRFVNTVEARIIVDNIAEELLKRYEGGKFLADSAARFTGGILTARVAELVTTLIEWMAQYEFDPALAEIGFGLEAEGFPAWRLELPEGRALLLRGRIDRVDVHLTEDETALAVVMDYKSSARKLDATKLHHGLELQLLSYLGVLRHLPSPEKYFGVKHLLPAGVFYVPLNGGATRRNATRSEVVGASAAEQRSACQHSGRFLADALKQFDNREVPKGDQFKFARKADGSLGARGNDALPADEFDALRKKIEGHLRDYGRRIFSGEVSVSPFRIGTQAACDRCDFRAICRFDPWTQPYRQLRPPPRPTKAETIKKGKKPPE